MSTFMMVAKKVKENNKCKRKQSKESGEKQK